MQVFVAFVNQQPILPALEHCNVDQSFDAAEDHVWSCRMVVIFAKILGYCFGSSHHILEDFNTLEGRAERWYVLYWSPYETAFLHTDNPA